MNKFNLIPKVLNKYLLNNTFYKIDKYSKTTKLTIKNDIEKKSVSKKANNTNNKPKKAKKEIIKDTSFFEEILQNEENFVSNFESQDNLKQIFIPLKHDIHYKKDEMSSKSKKYKKHKKSSKYKIDIDKNIEEIEKISLYFENIVLGNQNISEDPIFGKKICDVSDDNPYNNYFLSFALRKSMECIKFQNFYCKSNIAILPIFISGINGIYLQDINNFIYMDFASFSFGLKFGQTYQQSEKINHFFNNSVTGSIEAYNINTSIVYSKMKKLFGYEKMNFLTDQIESIFFSIKTAMKYISRISGSLKNKVIVMNNDLYNYFGKESNLFNLIPFNDISILEETLRSDNEICAVFLEPIQMQRGFIISDDDYLDNLRKLCTKYNVLMIVDETDNMGTCSGLSFTLKKNVKPDILIIGNSITGCCSPVSIVLSSPIIIDSIEPNDQISIENSLNPLELMYLDMTINYINDNKGLLFNIEAKEGIIASYLYMNCKVVKEIRGRGLMFAIELYEDGPTNAYDVSLYLMEKGIICRVLTNTVLCITSPLNILEGELYRASCIIIDVLKSLEKLYSDYDHNNSTQFNVNPINQISRDIVSKRFELLQEEFNANENSVLGALSQNINKV